MEYTELLERQIIGRLKIDNPWWTEGCIPEYYSRMTPRAYLDVFMPLVRETDLRRAPILMGPRRVGKTVMLFHSIQRLIDEEVPPQNIVYVSVETPIYNKIPLEQLFTLACRVLGKEGSRERMYVFFDEIQYLKDWGVDLKSLVDTYLNVKFIASGSAASMLRRGSNESGAGRFTDFMLPPVTFYEYINMKGHSNLMIPNQIEIDGSSIRTYGTIDITALNGLFIDYINYGGYPEIAYSDKIRENPGQFIRHDIIDKTLLRNMPRLYGVTNVQKLNSFFSMIAYHSGDQFSYETMSKESGVNKEIIRKFLNYLEAVFLIKVVRRTDETAKQYHRETQFKIYLTNPSLRCALFLPVDQYDEVIGNMVETAVYAQWFPRQGREIRYANWRQGRQEGEVDIVGIDGALQKPAWAVEIKWSDRPYEKPGDLSSLKYFMGKNNLGCAVVTSISKAGPVKYGDIVFQFIPAACYAYTVGENTINQTKSLFGL